MIGTHIWAVNAYQPVIAANPSSLALPSWLASNVQTHTLGSNYAAFVADSSLICGLLGDIMMQETHSKN